ncbi:MAG: pilus assembly protein TadD, partial [Phaeodactylibacter sp.]|nr:pilus assembly protein TadD [Phaeodactylibacter sp.]
MRLLLRSKLGWVAGGLVLVLLGLYCTQSPTETGYANHAADVAYVGMETCQSCHAEIHGTFIHTGMGQSFGLATREKSQAQYGPHALVYDTATNFYYFPYWRGEALWVKEFRLAAGDTIYKRDEQIDFIIGSGHHTNSHLVQTNGYLSQAPITYYTQEGKWDMAPGFKEGQNLRFSRVLTSECLT